MDTLSLIVACVKIDDTIPSVLSSARERTGANMRDKATIRRLQMYRTGGKVVRSVSGLYANYSFLMVWLQIRQYSVLCFLYKSTVYLCEHNKHNRHLMRKNFPCN